MPTKHAAFKALRKSRKNAEKNVFIIENIKYLIKHTKKSADAKNSEKAKEFLAQSVKAIDKAIQKGVFKKNNGARKKSRVTAYINALAKK